MSNQNIERFRLSKKASDFITQYAEEHNIPYRNRVLNEIIEDYANMPSKEEKQDDIIQSISQNISQEINQEIRRIRLGTNNADRNTQILIELIVDYMFNKNVRHTVTTDELGDDLPFEPYDIAKETVRQRIEHQKQRKDDRASKRNATNDV